MKTIMLLLLAGVCGLARAQTNPPAQKPPEQAVGAHYLPAQKPPEQAVGLHSDQFYFDSKTRQLVYFGNVVATNWEGTLTCDRLTIKLPAEGSADNHPTEIDAETNVVVDFVKNGDTNHIASDKAVYAYAVANAVTNETITFTGHAKAENDRGWMTGEPLVWDNIANRFSGTDFKTVFKSAPNFLNGTNAPPAGTNNLSQQRPKLPPGTIENIDRMILPP